jgi:hypothetical protein
LWKKSISLETKCFKVYECIAHILASSENLSPISMTTNQLVLKFSHIQINFNAQQEENQDELSLNDTRI